MSRSEGRLPVELYVDGCIKAAAAPREDVLKELAFGGLFEIFDEEGKDSWTFLCSSASRLGSETVRKGWECFQCTLTHYIAQGCLTCYESRNDDFGLKPLFSMLVDMRNDSSLPPYVLNGELLDRELGLSGYWKPRSAWAKRFLRAAIAALDLDVTRVLIRHLVPLNDPLDGDDTVIHYVCSGDMAQYLCSKAKGKEMLDLVLGTQSSRDMKTLSASCEGGGIIHGSMFYSNKKNTIRMSP
uniref:WGS project CBMI000000000 data, contig CS3069_c001076 n=1 Tax=Fusarium clavum TaxID=2594811 RepID=A0A090MHG5_9HYPO|nr:unnamed protein product [Fusarium clavum]